MNRNISSMLIIICVSLFISIASGLEGDIKSELENVINAYDRILEADSDNADAWLNKGITLIKIGKHSEGMRCIEKSVTLFICR